MAIPTIRHGVFFSPVDSLPRGRHALAPDAVALLQRDRLMAAFAELVADQGLAAVTVSDVVARTSVSRGAFYSCFDDLAGCGDAAYARFIEVLVGRLVEAMDPAAPWPEYVRSTVRAYLETLQADPVVARAMQIEMDAAGRAARLRRRSALSGLAELLRARHARSREEDPAMGPLPDEAHLGIVYAVRQLACDALEDDLDADLLALVDPVVRWVSAAYRGAEARGVGGGADATADPGSLTR